MKKLLVILLITISTSVFAQKVDTLKIELTPLQREEMIDGIEKRKNEILQALEKQRVELFNQLDEKAKLVLKIVLDSKGLKEEEIETFKYKDGILFITKKKKQP